MITLTDMVRNTEAFKDHKKFTCRWMAHTVSRHHRMQVEVTSLSAILKAMVERGELIVAAQERVTNGGQTRFHNKYQKPRQYEYIKLVQNPRQERNQWAR
jgi:hypothetical protein